MNPLPVGRDAVGIVGGAVEAGQGAGEGGQVLLNKASETCQTDRWTNSHQNFGRSERTDK